MTIIRQALPDDASQIALLAKALTDEIMERTHARHFNVDLAATVGLCRQLLEEGKYSVLLVLDESSGEVIGFAALCESHALYAEGAFGIIQEFYIRPDFRSRRLGARLLEDVAELARSRGWKRLELCTPPLPEFDRTLSFYAGNGFEITGGRKMKRLLKPT